jgi:DNA-binding transcriptional regulator YhcF (GntR family)
MTLLEGINKLGEQQNLSKHEQLVEGIIGAIDRETLKVGDQLPSINRMVSDLGYARKTIVKAYEELKGRGLVESKKLKGYFIVSKETNTTLKVALLLFSFQRFQEELYNTFRAALGDGYQIDVYFHHNNLSLFETIFENIQGKYGMFVVAPIPDMRISELLSQIEPEKLLVIDRFLPLDETYSYVSQEFENGTYEMLVQLLPSIKKYKKFVLFFNNGDCPRGMLNAFERFTRDFGIAGEVVKHYVKNAIEKETLYFFISDTFLWEVLKDCKIKGFVLGKDIGVLSHNDHIVKELVFGGITTISTDFKEMALMAAEYVVSGRKIQAILPLKLINRISL